MKSALPTASGLTRRDALKKTLYFTTGLMAGGLAAREPDLKTSEAGLNLLVVGDYGSKNESQVQVAEQMVKFTKKLNQPLEAVLALGDNFYGKMTPDRFERHFEKMYDPQVLNCPFYTCLGNHDYEYATYGQEPEPRKSDLQLKYAKENPTSRWKMPAKWYAFELPHAGKPLVKIIMLDSNLWEGALTAQEKLDQKRFLEAELAKGTTAPWLWLVWHHPLFTETSHRKDSGSLNRMFGDALKKHPVSLCLSGHDHNMQHLQIDDYKTSFVISGAGGAKSYEVKSQGRGFSKMTLGFNHIHVTPTEFKMQFINEEGQCLHAFKRGLEGKVKIIS